MGQSVSMESNFRVPGVFVGAGAGEFERNPVIVGAVVIAQQLRWGVLVIEKCINVAVVIYIANG